MASFHSIFYTIYKIPSMLKQRSTYIQYIVEEGPKYLTDCSDPTGQINT
jgi:hypothetical protein